MNIYMAILRFFHIISGVFWAGVALFLTGFLVPAINAAGPDGGKVMRGIYARKFNPVIMSAAGLSLLSGILMYIYDLSITDGLNWITSSKGLVLSIGVVMGAAGFVVGVMTGAASGQLSELGGEIAASGGPPSEGQQGRMADLQEKLGAYGRINGILLFIAMICMAIWRYV